MIKNIYEEYNLKLSIRQLNKNLQVLASANVIFCVDVKKKTRYWRVFEFKPLCISKTKVLEHQKNPTRIRQKVMNNSVHNSVHNSPVLENKVPQVATLGSPSTTLEFPNSGERSSIILEAIFEEKYLENEHRLPSLKPEKIERFLNTKGYTKLVQLYGSEVVDKHLKHFIDNGYVEGIQHLFSYTRNSIENERTRKKHEEIRLKNAKILKPKINALENISSELEFCFNKRTLKVIHVPSGNKTDIDLASSDYVIDLELRHFIHEYTDISLRL